MFRTERVSTESGAGGAFCLGGFAGEFRSDDSAGGLRVSRCRYIAVRFADGLVPYGGMSGFRSFGLPAAGCAAVDYAAVGVRTKREGGVVGHTVCARLLFACRSRVSGLLPVFVVHRSISSVAADGSLVRVASGCLSGSYDLTGCQGAVRPVCAAGVSVWEDSCGGFYRRADLFDKSLPVLFCKPAVHPDL